ncbi:MAG: GTPase Era, partial [Bacteroidota bacterium]
IKKTDIPIILIVNKIDLARENELEPVLAQWKEMIPGAHIIPVSALKGYYLPEVFDKILELLPENPPYYPKDALTDKSERFFVSEIIREKIFLNFQKEVPYSTEVQIEEFKDKEKILNIRATIYVMRDSQKAILIGSKGEAIKSIGIMAREELEALYEKQVFLDLYVKVHKEWRDKDGFLRSMGY